MADQSPPAADEKVSPARFSNSSKPPSHPAPDAPAPPSISQALPPGPCSPSPPTCKSPQSRTSEPLLTFNLFAFNFPESRPHLLALHPHINLQLPADKRQQLLPQALPMPPRHQRMPLRR